MTVHQIADSNLAVRRLIQNNRLFAALYVSEVWHAYWREKGSLFGKAKAVVLFDRIITGGEHRIQFNDKSLDDYLDEVKP